MYVCKDSAAPANARTRRRAHRPAAPRQSSGVLQIPHPHTTSRTRLVFIVCMNVRIDRCIFYFFFFFFFFFFDRKGLNRGAWVFG